MDREQPSAQTNLTRTDRDVYWRVLGRRLRLAYLAGAEQRSMRERGRPLTAEELRRVLMRYPGDPPER